MFQSLQSLFPALAQRSQAKRTNDFALKAESTQNIQREIRNSSSIQNAKLDAVNRTRYNSRNLKDFFNAQEAESLNHAQTLNAETARSLEKQIGKEAAQGVSLALAASRGQAGTGIASQIDAAQSARLRALDGFEADQVTARKYNQAANLNTLSAAAFSNFALDQSMVALDYSTTRTQRADRHSTLGAITRDVGRLVATYYGGKQAAEAIDKAEGYEQSYQKANAIQQSALDSIYGGSEKLRTASRPDFASIVGGLRGMYNNGSFDWSQLGQTTLQAFGNSQPGNNQGASHSDYQQYFDLFRNLGGSKSTGKPQITGGSLKLPRF